SYLDTTSCMLSIPFFSFFYCSCHPRDLHSFPTRRSSDLSLVWNFAILGVFKYYDFFAGSLVGALDQLGIHHLPLPLIRIILPPGDRKSTRLNSSHQIISYAVFCLKKKTTIDNRRY